MDIEDRTIAEKNFTLSSMLAEVSDLKVRKTKLRLYIKGIHKKDRISNFTNVEELGNGRGEWTVDGVETVRVIEVNYVSDDGETHKMPYGRFADLGKRDEIKINQTQRTTYE